MNGLEKLTGQIDADVQKEIDAALVQARSQAQEIQSWYESQAQIQVEAIRRKGQQDAVFRQERLVDEAKMQARRDILATKQELIGRAFDLALEKLLELPEKEYVALLADLAVRPEETLFVGDSGVDMQTAHNGGLTACGVTWGFRSRRELEDAGADHLADTPEALGDYILA